MATIKLGTDSQIGIGSAGAVAAGGTFVNIGGIVSGSFSISHNKVDTTNNTDAGVTSYKPGNTTISLSFEAKYDPTTTSGFASHDTLNAVAAEIGGGSYKVLKAFRVQPFGATNKTWAFDGYINEFSINVAENGTDLVVSIETEAVGASVGTAPTYDADGAGP